MGDAEMPVAAACWAWALANDTGGGRGERGQCRLRAKLPQRKRRQGATGNHLREAVKSGGEQGFGQPGAYDYLVIEREPDVVLRWLAYSQAQRTGLRGTSAACAAGA